MTRILIDLYKTRNVNSGIGRFSLNFAESLSNRSVPGYDFDFLCPRNLPEGEFGTNGLLKVNFRKRYLPWLNPAWDIWHSLDQFPSHRPNRRSKWILTIHDLNFLVEKDKLKAKRYLNRLQKNVDRATAISVISDYTRKQVLEHLDVKEKPLYRIYNGISVRTHSGAQKPGFPGNGDFFFAIGIISAKKNFHVLVPVLEKFPGYHLVIAGENGSDYAKGILEQARELGLSERVHLPGTIPEEQKNWLYTNCRAFLFPSLAEGFGMPVIEAMLYGKPVFASKFASLPEIGGEHAFYWQNFDPGHMVQVLQNGLADCDRLGEQFSSDTKTHAQKFSWDQCIDNYLSMYEEVLGLNP
ncbi:MAG: glycosyltransferase family 1 protein [bacterium]